MARLESGFQIGEFTVRPVEGIIDRPDGGARIEPKAMAVLLELARHTGEVCSREQIQQAVWPRGFTTDDVLTRCIGQIRKALGDDPKCPAFVETLPRRGYRLVQPVKETVPPAKTAIESTEKLIVLPFQYLASDEQDYIADGITELLTARLANLQGVVVISRTTAMHFRGSGETAASISNVTGARWVIEGSVLQSGNRMQMVVQLIDAQSDAHVWAGDFVRDISDILVLQNEIAQKIADAIRVRLGVPRSTGSETPVLAPDTVRDYLRGRQLLSNRSAESLREAARRFSRVCESAPEYAAAYASRAEAMFMLGHYGAEPPDRVFTACTEDLGNALKLDPDLAIALTCRGALRFGVERKFALAEDDLLRALQQMPGYSIAMLTLANVYAVQKQFEKSMQWLEQAVLIDPLDIGITMNMGDHLILQRRYDDAVAALDRAVDLQPTHRPSRLRRCWAMALDGHADAASTELEEIGPIDKKDWQWLEYAALVAGSNGDLKTAKRHYLNLEKVGQESFVSAWSLARAASVAEQVDAAIDWLKLARQQRSTSFPFVSVTPALDPLRQHEEFAALTASDQI